MCSLASPVTFFLACQMLSLKCKPHFGNFVFPTKSDRAHPPLQILFGIKVNILLYFKVLCKQTQTQYQFCLKSSSHSVSNQNQNPPNQNDQHQSHPYHPELQNLSFQRGIFCVPKMETKIVVLYRYLPESK